MYHFIATELGREIKNYRIFHYGKSIQVTQPRQKTQYDKYTKLLYMIIIVILYQDIMLYVG